MHNAVNPFGQSNKHRWVTLLAVCMVLLAPLSARSKAIVIPSGVAKYTTGGAWVAPLNSAATYAQTTSSGVTVNMSVQPGACSDPQQKDTGTYGTGRSCTIPNSHLRYVVLYTLCQKPGEAQSACASPVWQALGSSTVSVNATPSGTESMANAILLTLYIYSDTTLTPGKTYHLPAGQSPVVATGTILYGNTSGVTMLYYDYNSAIITNNSCTVSASRTSVNIPAVSSAEVNETLSPAATSSPLTLTLNCQAPTDSVHVKYSWDGAPSDNDKINVTGTTSGVAIMAADGGTFTQLTNGEVSAPVNITDANVPTTAGSVVFGLVKDGSGDSVTPGNYSGTLNASVVYD